MNRAIRAGGALSAGIALLCAGAIATAPASGPGGSPAPVALAAGKTVKVKVGDDFFSPIELKVKKGTKVKWKWLPDNFNPHNVRLKKGPRGVKKKDYKSPTGSIGIRFNRKLTKPGRYDFICAIHATVMQHTIKVKK